MLNILLKYGVAAHVAALAIYASWARGGSAPAFFWALPWLSLLILEGIFLLPPVRQGESVRGAIRRVWRRMYLDPLFYIGLALIVFLVIQWLNGPRELTFNAAAAIWEYTPPPLPGLPFSVVRAETSQVLNWAICVFAILMAVRHGMTTEAHRWLLRVLVYNGAILSAVGLVHLATGTDKLFGIRPIGVFFFSTFGYPNHASAYFTLLTALSLGLLIAILGDERQQERPASYWLSVAFVLNLMGVVFSLGRAGMLLTGGILVAGAIYAAFYLWRRMSRSTSLRLGAMVGCLVLFAAFFFIKMPDNPIAAEIKTIDITRLHEQLQGDRAELASSAIDIWRDYPWTGVGGWGFRRHVGIYMGPERYEYLKAAGRANVHNDAIQYLCEHGMIGLTLILGLIFIPVGHLIYRLVRVAPRDDHVTGTPISWFRRVTPIVWFIIMGTGATVIHSLIDLPFRSIAIISAWFICLSTAPFLLPAPEKSKKQSIL